MIVRYFLIGLLIAFTGLAPVWAAEPAETDPFHPGGRKVTAPAPARDRSGGGRDPFETPFSRKPSGSAVQPLHVASGGLTGIIFSKQARVAIMNGAIVREGSMVGEKVVIDIRRKSVVLKTAAGALEELVLQDFSMGK